MSILAATRQEPYPSWLLAALSEIATLPGKPRWPLVVRLADGAWRLTWLHQFADFVAEEIKSILEKHRKESPMP